MPKEIKTITYVPNMHIKMGIKIWSQMFHETFECRELTWRLFIRDISAKYRQSFLGYVWAVLLPFIAIGSFMILNRSGILNIGETSVPYPLFALIGLTVWQVFATGIVSGTNSLVTAGGMIAKINFPRESLVFASMAQALFEFLIKFVLIAIFFFLFKITPSIMIIIFPLSVIPIVLLTLGLSLVLSLVNGILRDTANIVSLVANFLLFLTPVLYPVTGDKSLFFALNPFTSLINAPRDLILYGFIKDPQSYFIASALSLLVFLTSWRVFHLAETKIPERI